MSVWGISRPAASSKRRLTTQAGDFSLEREIAPPRVQAGAESGKMHVDLCPRGDLNPETREISPVWGNFHEPSITAGARGRQAFRVASCFPAAGDVRAGRSGALERSPASRSVLSAESGQAKYPPLWSATKLAGWPPGATPNRMIWASRPDGAQALDVYTGGLARRRDEPPLESSAPHGARGPGLRPRASRVRWSPGPRVEEARRPGTRRPAEPWAREPPGHGPAPIGPRDSR